MSELFALSQGSGPKIIILLHGFGGHHGVWHEIQPILARGAQVIAYDLPGHGRSLDYEDSGPPSVAAKAIIADLAKRDISHAHFVGHSMGGAISTLIALRAPDLVQSLTLFAPGGFGPEINADLLRRFGAATKPDELRLCLEEMSAPGFRMPSHAVTDLAQMHARQGQRDKLVEIAQLITRDGKQGVIPADALAALQIPVHVAWGTADPVLSFSHTRHLPAHFQLEVWDDKGHMLIEESGDQVLALIKQMTI